MTRRLLLARHPPVAKAWASRCYGRSDVGLSREGRAVAIELAKRLAAEPIDLVVHSGAKRTAVLAQAVARQRAASIRSDARWLERDFCAWEGRSWSSIWRETGDLMDRMITDPDEFRPGGGETGAELHARVLSAWRDLPSKGVTLIVSHGGPIAALRAYLASAPLGRMVDYIPQYADIVEA